MKSVFINILAVVLGLFIGSGINMGLIMLGGSVIPPPEGINPTDIQSLKEGMHMLGAQHFLFPFLAHSLGTLVGALIASGMAASQNFKLAIGIGIFFLAGGIANAFILPAPIWFIVVDLLIAYIPMGWLGGYLATPTPK